MSSVRIKKQTISLYDGATFMMKNDDCFIRIMICFQFIWNKNTRISCPLTMPFTILLLGLNIFCYNKETNNITLCWFNSNSLRKMRINSLLIMIYFEFFYNKNIQISFPLIMLFTILLLGLNVCIVHFASYVFSEFLSMFRRDHCSMINALPWSFLSRPKYIRRFMNYDKAIQVITHVYKTEILSSFIE